MIKTENTDKKCGFSYIHTDICTEEMITAVFPRVLCVNMHPKWE